MSRDPLPVSCLFTGDPGGSVQPWQTWQVVPLAMPLAVPLAVALAVPLAVPGWLSCWGLQSPGFSVLRLHPVVKFPIAAWAIQPPCVSASGGSGVSPLSQLPVPWKSIVVFALNHTGVRMRFYPAHCPDRLCCILGPLGMDTGGSLQG